ncbi:flagellin [uncultured Anaerovibrio sp.]|uniref:flagellin n=1 Tax=uncultured Anaerovibrio sp. TaxID=361586 RepID=UPI00260D8EDA|nr:flagellin [uncultured Anaerovibrio sp.]
MGIVNNISSNMILGELHKNTKKKDKASAQLALGEKIRNAGDDASGFAISEKMRVRIRALGQDEDNVKKGASMLKTAEGAIQSQINLLRTIKEKVIDAHNDTNTDTDRAIIQKEISQYYDEINDIAAETTFNKKLLLLGNTVQETISSWRVLDEAVPIDNSSIGFGLIHDATYAKLDGEDGPFAIFDEWKITSSEVDMTSDGGVKVNSTNAMSGGTEGEKKKVSWSFGAGVNDSNVKNVLSGTGIRIGYNYYVFTDTNNAGNTYYYNNSYTASKIDISGCNSVSSVLDKIISTANKSGISLSKDGNSLVCEASSYTNNSYAYITSWNIAPKAATPATNISGSGLFTPSKRLSGGTDASGLGNADSPLIPATKAKLTVNGTPTAGTGMTVGGTGIKFVEGSKSPSTVDCVYTVGVNCTSFSIGGTDVTISGGKMTFTARSAGSSGNSITVSDGYYISGTPEILAVSNTPGSQTVLNAGSSGGSPYYELDLSAYDTTDTDVMENFISEWVGKALSHSAYNYHYEFIDSKDQSSIDSVRKIDYVANYGQYAYGVDLNALRTKVASGQTIASAFADLVVGKSGLNNSKVMDTSVTPSQFTNKIRFYATSTTATGQTVNIKQGNLRSYTLDFKNWFSGADLGGLPLSEALDGKGFKAYCATDSAQWFNFSFVNSSLHVEDDKPASGTDALDIKSISIDITGIDTPEDLVQAIYDQGEPQLKAINHFMNVVIDKDAGTLTLYDSRGSSVDNRTYYPDKQEKGAKIADGVLDNVVKDVRYLYVNDLVIHHTDRASANIHVRIPQTTMDQIFGYRVGTYSLDDYSVMTSEKREKLLGTDGPPKVEGTLDKGLQYLIDANTLIGAQIVHMEHAEANIITDQESTTSAESVIRDADMAKSSLELATAQILAQAGQTMLSQSNQNSSNVLSLLQ